MTAKCRGKEDDKNSVMHTERGQSVDKKTRQLLFFQCEMETIKQVFLKSSEEFSQTGANSVYEKYQKKRQSKCKAYCLVDRIRFQKRGSIGSSPFRKELTYREIKHFFVFPSNPSVFMLCTTSEKNGKRAYEAFRCNPEHVTIICDLTYRASTDPQNILRETVINHSDNKTSNGHGRPYLANSELFSDGEIYESPIQTRSFEEPIVCDRQMIVPDTPIISAYMESSSSSDFLPRKTLNPRLQPKSNSLGAVNMNNSHMEKTVTGVYSYYEVHEPEKTTQPPVSHKPRLPAPSPYPFREHNLLLQRTAASPTFDSQYQDSPGLETNQPVYKNPQILKVNHSNRTKSNGTPIDSTREPQWNEPRHVGRIIIERDTDYKRNPDTSKRRAMSTQNLLWGDEVTYISSDPTKGVSVTDNGPIFMYITRYASQQDLNSITKTENHVARSSNLHSFTEEEFLADIPNFK